ncbi:hypothetical protein BD779DRAFT_1559883 [Infundibulicybe gibba]|nr:hypothetical protein BD779DRAFT_1559883 [Infundibulicybe gibba]
MGKFYDEIPEYLVKWISKQKVFWVASAPLSPEGHINISPKGMENTFHIVNPRRVWYEDLTGSGKIPITIMFSAFEGPPQIVRLFGRGTVHEYGTPEYAKFLSPTNRQPGSRAIIVVDIHQVGTTCGWAVPFYTFKAHRNQLLSWAAKLENVDTESPTPLPEGGLRSCLDNLPGITAHLSDDPFKLGDITYPVDDISTPAKISTPLPPAPFIDTKSVMMFSLGVLFSALYVRFSGTLMG